MKQPGGKTDHVPALTPSEITRKKEEAAKLCREEQRQAQRQQLESDKTKKETDDANIRILRDLMRPICENAPWNDVDTCDDLGLKVKPEVLKKFHEFCARENPEGGKFVVCSDDLIPLPQPAAAQKKVQPAGKTKPEKKNKL